MPTLRHFTRTACLVILLAVPQIAAGQAVTPQATPPNAFGVNPDSACYNSRLKVGDLANADASIQQGVARATRDARAWQPDAQLTSLRLVCPLLTTGLRWEGVFFSAEAQAYYSTDTGRKEAVEEDPDTIPILDPATISLKEAYRSLVRGGFDDDMYLTAQGGVTIKMSTDDLPFGPPAAPRGQLYAHLAVDDNGLVTDVWVSLADGTIYRYAS